MSDRVVTRLYALYQKGLSLGAIAKKRGSSRQNIQQIFKRRGLERRSRFVACGWATPAMARQMHRDYVAGLSCAQVGRIYGRAGGTVNGIFRRRGFRRRSNVLPPALVRSMHNDYKSGLTLHQVGLKYGRSEGSAWSAFKRRNLKMRPGYGGVRRRYKRTMK